MDTSNGFWFLPGGGVEQNESMEEAGEREAAEELGVEIKINRIIRTYHVTLISEKTGEQLKIHPFIVVHATYTGGLLRTEYAPNRKILLVGKDECDNLLQDFEVPQEYECMKPYLHISKQAVREFVGH
jgi:8-oxo-dGTP pyrophosphatase MutT (NUDIX family)